METKKIVLIVRLIGLIFSLAGFVWLFFIDWKIAIALFFILWGNNISTKKI